MYNKHQVTKHIHKYEYLQHLTQLHAHNTIYLRCCSNYCCCWWSVRQTKDLRNQQIISQTNGLANNPHTFIYIYCTYFPLAKICWLYCLLQFRFQFQFLFQFSLFYNQMYVKLMKIKIKLKHSLVQA